MENLALIGTITLVHLLAVISPGPDFVIAVKNSLTYSRKIGIWTALGFSLGIIVHVFYCLAGLAIVISQSIMIFNIIKISGAIYLIYIGLKSLFVKSNKIKIENLDSTEEISPFKAVKIGFLTNLLNPKATLFFLSLFTFIISPETPKIILIILCIIFILNTFLWFALLAFLLTQNKILNIFNKYQNIVSKILGVILISLGMYVALF